MSGAIDKAAGRAKEAVGILLDDEKLKREGRLDQAAGEAKEAVEQVVDHLKARIERKAPA